MKRAVVVLSIVAFAAVLAAPALAQDDAVTKGKAAFAAQKCSMCHAIEGKGNKNMPLDGVGSTTSASADSRAVSSDRVSGWAAGTAGTDAVTGSCTIQ